MLSGWQPTSLSSSSRSWIVSSVCDRTMPQNDQNRSHPATWPSQRELGSGGAPARIVTTTARARTPSKLLGKQMAEPQQLECLDEAMRDVIPAS
jgi:hypothetical protein